jgi:hypothetical protein
LDYFAFLSGKNEGYYNLLKNATNLEAFSILRPDWPFLFHSMKGKQKSCQNEPSAGRFDGPRTRFI